MKKMISLVLVAALLLSLFTVTAFAAEPTSGPAQDVFIYGGARVGVTDAKTENSIYVMNFDYDKGSGFVIDNKAVPGMTYDLDTNTLTIEDVHQSENELFIWYMGNDFKLNVKGENEFGIISVNNYSDFYDTSLNIVGDGTLTVNGEKLNDKAINLFADGQSPVMSLDIADTVNVHLYNNAVDDEEKPLPLVYMSGTAITPEDGGAITVGGKAIDEVKNERIVKQESDMVPVINVSFQDEDFVRGTQVKSKSDPDGVYVLAEIMDGASYVVQRYMYVEELGLWVVDRGISDQGFVGRRYTKEEFEAEYDYVYGMAPTRIQFMEAYKENYRGYEGSKLSKDGDADAVYVAQPAGGIWDWGDDDNYTGSYAIRRVKWDDDQEIYVEDPSFEVLYLMADELEDCGYHIERETVDEPLEMTVWTSEDPSDTSRFEMTKPVLYRASDPDGLYIQTGVYPGDGDDGSITIHKVHYNPETEEHYILYSNYSSSEYFMASNADIESGESDFSYAVEPKTKHVKIRFLPDDYDISMDTVIGTQLKKESEPDTVYAYKQWTHYGADDSVREEYSIVKLDYSEKIGCYVEDADFEEIEFYDLSELDQMGYTVVYSEQPIDYVTKGRVELSEYPVYTDDSGNNYFVDYLNRVYTYSDENTITLNEKSYYFGTEADNVSVKDLHDTIHDVATDQYSYWISGPEYHHVAGETPEPVAYDLWVNGEQVTSDHLTVTCGNGTAVYDPAKNTLTLNNAEITQGTDKDWTYSGVLSQMDSLNVVIKGNCTITETQGDGIGTYNSESYQIGDVIYPAPYDLTITGDGTLTINESTPFYGYGLYCTGDLVIDGITLNINSAAAGVWASDLKMNNVNADIHTSSWYSGIVVNRGSFAFTDSTVSAESAQGAGLLLGNDHDDSVLTVNSGALNLKGKIGVQGPVDTSIVTVNGGKLAINATDAAFDDSFLADNAKNIVMAEGIGVTSGAIDGNAVVIEKLPAPGGFTLSGTATSYKTNDGVDDVTLKLTGSDNNYTDSVTVTATYSGVTATTDYVFENVPAGEYTLSVEKGNHVTREYTVSVSADTTQDVKICPIGDVNMNGRVQSNDATKAYKHVQGGAEDQLTDYAFKCADVNKNGRIQSNDATQIYRQTTGAHNLF